MRAPANPPTGRLDAFDVGSKKLTVQTEFFADPEWRIETKVYLGGELKKVYNGTPADSDADLQRSIDEFHRARLDEIAEGLRNKRAQ